MRTHLFSSLGALKIGMDILFELEKVKIDQLLGHGGFFKTREVGQRMMAAAMNVPVSVMETAGEGGAWGIALLAAYMVRKTDGEPLEAYLAGKVFAGRAGLDHRARPKRCRRLCGVHGALQEGAGHRESRSGCAEVVNSLPRHLTARAVHRKIVVSTCDRGVSMKSASVRSLLLRSAFLVAILFAAMGAPAGAGCRRGPARPARSRGHRGHVLLPLPGLAGFRRMHERQLRPRRLCSRHRLCQEHLDRDQGRQGIRQREVVPGDGLQRRVPGARSLGRGLQGDFHDEGTQGGGRHTRPPGARDPLHGLHQRGRGLPQAR